MNSSVGGTFCKGLLAVFVDTIAEQVASLGDDLEVSRAVKKYLLTSWA